MYFWGRAMQADVQTSEPTISQTIFESINRFLDRIGYLLMLVLSLTIWWGIYSGVSLSISAQEIPMDITESAPTDSVSPPYRVGWLAAADGKDKTTDESWSMSSVY